MTPLQVLQSTFGYSEFRGHQEEIIQTVLDGRDSLVIMPTGGGKSLCYQLPSLILDGVTVVVSPLIALMNDQVAALKQIGVVAGSLHSNMESLETQEVYEKLDSGQLDLLYVSPEKILSGGFMAYLKDKNVQLIAIDEAHCVSVWGNDFRPEYVRLSILKKEFPKVPTIALTATADPATREDIVKQLNLHNSKTFVSSFERKNIFISAVPGQKRMEQIIQFVGQRKGQAGIIYCLSRKSTEKVAQKLQGMGWRAYAYHAGMEGSERTRIQKLFQDDELDIVCATIAFGMGIDKPNIRYIIHYNMPKTLEGYYQEIGRAGRDGSDAESLLFASWGDRLNLQKFIDDSPGNSDFKNVQSEKLERMWQFANEYHCRTNVILSYFGEYRNTPCGHCDNCLNPPSYFDGSTLAQMAISAVIRCKEELNLQSLIDVLKGSYSDEVKYNNWDRVKTFGVGRQWTFIQWKHYLTQIINQGLLTIDYSNSSKIKVTPLSGDIIKGQSVELVEYEAPSKKKSTKKLSLSLTEGDVNENLLNELKSWRAQKAREQKVPAYVILHDKALKQIATSQPKQSHELLLVDGIGEKKLERYGEEVLAIVNRNDV